MDFYKNPDVLHVPGYEIYFTRFADSIIKDHFKEALDELGPILDGFYIPEGDITKLGGGLSVITQALGGRLKSQGWEKKNITSSLSVEGKVRAVRSHEVDHYRTFDRGSIGLEIEWNNKDTYYVRDLENFARWHQINEMALGIVITRGTSLHEEALHVFERFLSALEPFDVPTLAAKLSASQKAIGKFEELMRSPKEVAVKEIAYKIHISKFASSTTHMGKLQEYVRRGAGDPCPLIMIGVGKERLIR